MAPTILKLRCIFLLFTVPFLASILAESDVYIIHMNMSAMPNAFLDHHNWYLATLDSVSDPSEANIPTTSSKLIYTYTNAVHGFSASLTNSELELLKKSYGYLSCTRDRALRVHTTHTPQFLGLSSVSGSGPASNGGEDVIIGVVDSGIWPESESFNDEGMTGVPSRWKGKCESGTNFKPSLCNKKLIGARFYNKGALAKDPELNISMNSTRDTDGHGTHTSSTAAGSYVKGANLFGYANGTARGMAPGARIAMYKVIWDRTSTSDVLAAIDQAIQDGVDVLSLSLGFGPYEDSFLSDDLIAVGTFAAMENGIFVAASAGNDGSDYFSVHNGAPWLTTVAAGTMDRLLGGVLTLGNGKHVNFFSLYIGNSSLSQMPLVFMDECLDQQELKKIRNKIIVCKGGDLITSVQVQHAETAGVLAAVFTTEITLSEPYTRSSFPAAFVSLSDGEEVIRYVNKSKNPRGSLQFLKTILGTKPAPMVDDYSSRGPFLTCRNIPKPDIMAPGTLVLASWSPLNSVADVGSRSLFRKFNILSGTSMATPHVAGAAALIKQAHPDWSPAAIRSALMTTADTLDNTLNPIKDIGNQNLPASPLAMGAGHINPTKSLDPGLIYNATADDYIQFLCAMNYSSKQIHTITRSAHNHDCANRSFDLNYPSFIALFRSEDDESFSNTTVVREFQRTLTNVGEGNSSYTAKLTGMEGIEVRVKPRRLVFRKKYEEMRYKLRLKGPRFASSDGEVFGSLSWIHDNGKYVVRSPIVVTTLLPAD